MNHNILMMEKEDILTLAEKKIETCEESAESSRTSKHYITFFFVCLYFLQKDCLSFSISFFFVFLHYIFPFYSHPMTSVYINFLYSLCISQTPCLVSQPCWPFYQHLGYFIWSTLGLFWWFKLLLYYHGCPQPIICYTPRISATMTNLIWQSWRDVVTLIDLLSVQTHRIP